jgi:hypothetical protein
MKTLACLLTGFFVCAGTLRPAENANGSTTADGFAKLKSLAGEWEANTKMGKAHLTYELVSGGSAILERETTPGMPTMLTVYYMDGNRLLLTHYCMAGNQPRMQATSFDTTRNELAFGFLDATNLENAKAGHMHSAKMRFIDNQHLASEWVFFENGAPKMTESAEYTKVR